MAVGQGWKSWASLKKEVTYGTDPGGARDGYFRIVPPDSISVDKSYYQSPGAGTLVVRGLHEGVFVCGGDIQAEGNFEGGHLHLLRAGLGGYTFTGSNPVAGMSQHQFDASTGEFFYSLELSRGDIPANDIFLYTGTMVDVMEFGLQQDQLLGVKATVICRDETPDLARVAAPTYPAELPVKNVYYNPTYATQLAIAVGSNITTLQQGTIRVSNRLERRPNLGKFTAQPIRSNQRECVAELSADFEDLTHYNKFLAETEGAFSLKLTGPIATGASRFDILFASTTSHMTGGTPPIENMGLLRAPINLQFIKDAIEFTVTIHNTQNVTL